MRFKNICSPKLNNLPCKRLKCPNFTYFLTFILGKIVDLGAKHQNWAVEFRRFAGAILTASLSIADACLLKQLRIAINLPIVSTFGVRVFNKYFF